MKNSTYTPENTNVREVILCLIQNDLRTSCLVSGLDGLGLDAVQYHLTVSEAIFKLMGFKPEQIDERLLDMYCEEIGKGAVVEVVASPERLGRKAWEIFECLLNQRY